jgi:hypothetical protein
MIFLIVIVAWIVLCLFGWSLLCVAAQADRNSSVQLMRPWTREPIVPEEDARGDEAGSVTSVRTSQTHVVEETRVRVHA